ncbi:hypothetical protein RF11_01643 [Thelohanellus kitauei]|uniref:Uncharacterized protein n=1 Tax=Thelohanellus kitauei TaxID=669202 RepID=A0A0C2IXU0_THEKT|nr:hypothetical protein RF11_01643 [Thelohanellus kitauei]
MSISATDERIRNQINWDNGNISFGINADTKMYMPFVWFKVIEELENRYNRYLSIDNDLDLLLEVQHDHRLNLNIPHRSDMILVYIIHFQEKPAIILKPLNKRISQLNSP